MGGRLQSVGGKLTAGLTLPIVAAGAALIGVGNKFDDASDSIRAATGATGKALDGLNVSFKKVLSSVPASMTDTANAIGDLHVRTGLSGSALEGMAAQMLNLSRLTGSEVAPLVATTTRLFGDWSIATKDQSAALDFLFRTSQSTGIEVSRLSDLVVQFGAPLRALGFDFEQAAAMMGKWEKEGVNLETLLSGLRFALGNFAKAGLEPQAALQAVIDKIQHAKTESEATGIAFQVFGKRAAVDMSRAIIEGRFNIDGLVTSLKNSKETINSAATATLSLGERMQLLGNRVMVAVEPLATRLVGALERLVIVGMPVFEWLTRVVALFGNLPTPIQTGVIAFFALAAALGPVTFAFGTIIRAGAGLISFFRLLGGSTALGAIAPSAFAARAAVTSFAAAALAIPGVQVAAAVTGIAVAFGLLVPKIREAIHQFGFWHVAQQGFWQSVGTMPFIGPLIGGRATGRARPGSGGTGKDINLPVDPVVQFEQQMKAALGDSDAILAKLLKPTKADDPLKPLRDRLSGATVIGEAKAWMSVLEDIGGLTHLTADEQRELNRVLSDALAKYVALGQVAPEAMFRTWAATAGPSLEPLTPNNLPGTNMGLPRPLPLQIPIVSGITGLNLPGAQPLPTPVAPPGFFQSVFGSSKEFGANLAQAVMNGGLGSVGSFLGGSVMGKLGESLSKQIGGFLGGALGSVLGPLGSLAGSLLGKLGGGLAKMFGRGDDGDKQRDQFLAQMGGFDALAKKLHEVGAAGDQMFNKLINAKNGKEATAAIDQITAALERQKEAIDNAMSALPGGANARAANINNQADFATVGAEALGAMTFLIQQGQSAVQAFQAIAPAVNAMKEAQAANNFEMTTAATRLFELNDLLTQHKIQFDNIAASGTIMSAMLQANIRDAALFGAVAGDIGTQIQTVIDKGVPMAQVFALAQPQLQAIWEAQKQWGFAVDETTAKLLAEAEAQGFVGAHMKDVNQKILDVLIAIGDVLGAKIPDALRGLPAVAQEAANGMNNAFATVRGPQVHMEGWEDWIENRPEPDLRPLGDVPQMAGGGIVRARPGGTLVNVGEGGHDEAIIPLLGGRGAGGGTAQIIIDGRLLAEIMVPHQPGVVRRYGLG